VDSKLGRSGVKAGGELRLDLPDFGKKHAYAPAAR